MSIHVNWQQLLQENGIPYVTGGKNTGKGYISIKCPLCGINDPSEHLGINLRTGSWSCWRDSNHHGASPSRFLEILLGLSKGAARLLVEAHTVTGLDEFGTSVGAKTPLQATSRPELLNEFRPIEEESFTHKFWQYLQDRGFSDPDALAVDYQLKACLTGRWKGRLITPVFDEKGLVGWQGRAIQASQLVPKYLTSSDLIKKTIFNFQNLLDGGESLIICEGPFDALKVDFYGKNVGMRATCLFGVNFTPDQITKILTLRRRFRRFIALFDVDAPGLMAGFNLSNYITEIEFGQLPDGVHDPGSLSKQQVMNLGARDA
jgi:hypothetical protein